MAETFNQIVGFIRQYNLTVATTLVGLGWAARTQLQKLVTNHMAHFKADIVAAVQDEGDKTQKAIKQVGSDIVIAVLEAKK